ncbi:MAG: hypothetical protein V7K67_16665 [Nostoc sp.]|uniref:hypothetical protein n=1 Tax=Nostoc sp. TaxID=1180 RepID=UPI002FF042A4
MVTAQPITIDLFAGAGGFGLGFEMAGFSVPRLNPYKPSHREERFDEKFLCQYNQLGNAVPPILAKAIALHLQEKLELCPKAIGTL